MPTKIGWCWGHSRIGETWINITGCNDSSCECELCYAKMESHRKQFHKNPKIFNKYSGTTKMTSHGVKWTGLIKCHRDALRKPYHFKQPRMIFVNSMSDTFHEQVPSEFIQDIFKVMNDNPKHIFQVLTKRSTRLLELSHYLNWTPNIWMGVSCGIEESKFQIDNLRKCGAQTKFLSLEPLLEPLPNLNLIGIDWVIVGAESRMGFVSKRKCELDWVRDIRDQCSRYGAALFVKQLSNGKDRRIKHNVVDFPEDLRIQEFPPEVL